MDIELEGIALLTDPLLNKGSAFTEDERGEFHLHGLLPPHVGTLDEQVERRLKGLRKFETDLERYLFLRALQDSNETLFYALSEQHIAIVGAGSAGCGIGRCSTPVFQRPRHETSTGALLAPYCICDSPHCSACRVAQLRCWRPPYPVGFKQIEFTDDDRHITLAVFYPAASRINP